jgi:DNA-binding NtrC family response regulator
LKNALTQAIVFSDSDEITETDFFDRELPGRADFADTDSSKQSGYPAIDLSQPIDIIAVAKKHDLELKQKYVALALEKSNGNKTQAAQSLGTSPQTLDNWEKHWQNLNQNSLARFLLI